ncbi:hypothetical protein [Mycobacterium kyogaense]|uniref:hypothetical protein n=1 Tax=Mycobacterium kyogaense TaxID=2212479 RepID=UPI000DACAA8D|nr:hypothetical protein [Mycobacterium kyogaense]
MPDTSRDPVDHSRTYRQYSGETMKAGKNALGLIGIGLGVLSLVIALFSFANGSRTTGVIAVILAVVLAAAGFGWITFRHRKVVAKNEEWYRNHPDVPYEPPTS